MAEPQNREKSGRDAKGRFTAGNRANPGGRPKSDPRVQDILARGGAPAAELMVRTVADPNARMADRLDAAKYVLDRLFGKSAQPIIADIHATEAPPTLAQVMARARELLGTDDPDGGG